MNAIEQTDFRRQLDALPSWKDRSERIETRLRESCAALASRNEKLLSLRSDFDGLTRDFWRAFSEGLGCENPTQTIVTCREKMRSPGYIATIEGLACALLLFCVIGHDNAPLAVIGCLIAGSALLYLVISPRRQIANAQKVAPVLARETEPFWLTAGSIALSNLSVTPPAGAKWFTEGHITFVFLRHVAVRWTIDGFNAQVLWQDRLLSNGQNDNPLSAGVAAQILKDLQRPALPANGQRLRSIGEPGSRHLLPQFFEGRSRGGTGRRGAGGRTQARRTAQRPAKRGGKPPGAF
jgi:hypothetical protein